MSIALVEKVLIVSITPYFLEKGNFWFKENLKNLLDARKTQAFFEDNTLYLETNQQAGLSQILRKLDEMGYEKVLKAEEPGEFSQIGGIIDVFPINSNTAFRLEFLGNRVESIEESPIAIENEKATKERLKKRLKSQKLFSDLKCLKAGDYLVHLDHGVARFAGIENIQFAKSESKDYYILEYAANDKLFIPLGLERKLSRYIGFTEPKISRLGSLVWQKTKRKAKEDAEKLAKELLDIAINREVASRPPYAKDAEIEQQIINNFPYKETSDQIQTMEEISNDLRKNKPMDRLVCGDVGFGKTEVALRAAIKTVNSGYFAALLCPTTILAEQHFQNFRERLKNLPINIASLSRLQSKKEQERIINNLKEGKIDILIGTHRILSNDITPFLFQRNDGRGLLIVDDEQRFGVKQKEKIKKLRSNVDLLSLSATPIPRTLYFALSSLKDVSLIQTPPAGRLAVKTFIEPWHEKTIKKAIKEELKRHGQVYYLHNRVETIPKIKRFLEKLISSSKIEVVHGRQKEKELMKSIDSFRQKKNNILLATTIIENGIDLPNVNTLIVDDASRLGLSQAYQIKGRVGRSHQQAFAYFLYGNSLTEKARLRLKELKEAEELGSGYRIALKDLEIRGAGNILGREQSGNVNRVGLNLYCQILSDAVEKLKNTV